MIRSLCLFLFAVVFLSGCGYQMGVSRPTPMRTVKTLAVPNFKNRTYEPRVSVLLADTLIKHLQEDGTYTITSDQRADAIVECTLNKVQRRSVRSVQNNVLATAEFELILDVRYRVIDRITQTTLMDGRVRGRTTFFSGNDLQTIERQAIPVAAKDMANQLTAAIAEGW